MANRRSYCLLTKMSMVVGTVIGSGVFFKTGTMLKAAGNGTEVLLAWVVGGAGMMLCLLSFACAVRICGNENGLIEIAEEMVGKGFAYYLGRFMVMSYYPAMACVLARLSSIYLLMTFGIYFSSGRMCIALSFLILIFSFFQNFFFSGTSGRIQVVTTIVKLIPLVMMIVLGPIKGNGTGTLQRNLCGASPRSDFLESFWSLVASVLFAYEGWIASLSAGDDSENSKGHFHATIITGGAIVVFVYVFYSIGIMSVADADIFLNYGNEGVKIAFSEILGETGAGLLTAFVAISCIGALNGMMLGLRRTVYSLNHGGRDNFLKWLVILVSWMIFFVGTSVTEHSFFSGFRFDISEIPVITLYVMYIPIFVKIIKHKSLGRMCFVVAGGILFCTAVVAGVTFTRFSEVMRYLPMLAAVMLPGMSGRKKQS